MLRKRRWLRQPHGRLRQRMKVKPATRMPAGGGSACHCRLGRCVRCPELSASWSSPNAAARQCSLLCAALPLTKTAPPPRLMVTVPVATAVTSTKVWPHQLGPSLSLLLVPLLLLLLWRLAALRAVRACCREFVPEPPSQTAVGALLSQLLFPLHSQVYQFPTNPCAASPPARTVLDPCAGYRPLVQSPPAARPLCAAACVPPARREPRHAYHAHSCVETTRHALNRASRTPSRTSCPAPSRTR
jgi:hypothetical protein